MQHSQLVQLRTAPRVPDTTVAQINMIGYQPSSSIIFMEPEAGSTGEHVYVEAPKEADIYSMNHRPQKKSSLPIGYKYHLNPQDQEKIKAFYQSRPGSARREGPDHADAGGHSRAPHRSAPVSPVQSRTRQLESENSRFASTLAEHYPMMQDDELRRSLPVHIPTWTGRDTNQSTGRGESFMQQKRRPQKCDAETSMGEENRDDFENNENFDDRGENLAGNEYTQEGGANGFPSSRSESSTLSDQFIHQLHDVKSDHERKLLELQHRYLELKNQQLEDTAAVEMTGGQGIGHETDAGDDRRMRSPLRESDDEHLEELLWLKQRHEEHLSRLEEEYYRKKREMLAHGEISEAEFERAEAMMTKLKTMREQFSMSASRSRTFPESTMTAGQAVSSLGTVSRVSSSPGRRRATYRDHIEINPENLPIQEHEFQPPDLDSEGGSSREPFKYNKQRSSRKSASRGSSPTDAHVERDGDRNATGTASGSGAGGGRMRSRSVDRTMQEMRTADRLDQPGGRHDYPDSGEAGSGGDSGTEERRKKITIPKPFSFTFRDRIQRKTISQIRLEEDLARKQAEEEAELQKRFRANPLPSSTLMPKFSKIMEEQQERREDVRRKSMDLLRSQEQPFSFYGKQLKKSQMKHEEEKPTLFRANPIPESTYSKELERIRQLDDERKIRIKERAEALRRMSKLPPRMEMWEQERLKKERGSGRLGSGRSSSAKPLRPTSAPPGGRSNAPKYSPPKARPIPDFAKLQRDFDDKLREAKRSHPKTQPAPFPLNETKDSRPKIIEDMIQDQIRLKELRWPYVSNRAPLQKTPIPSWIGSKIDPSKANRAFQLRTKVVDSIREQKKMDEELEAEMERRRIEKARHMGKVLKPLLKDNTAVLENRSKENRKKFLSGLRELEQSYSQFLREMDVRVHNSAFLFEQVTRDQAKRRAQAEFERTLVKSGCESTLDYLDEQEILRGTDETSSGSRR